MGIQNSIYLEIIKKKDFSKLPKKDVEMAWSKFSKRQVSENEKIRLTRELLHKVYGAFSSKKLLSPKEKPASWILRKHISTRERLGFYEEVYSKLLKDFEKGSVVDLGAGVNGFSYEYFKKGIKYVGVEGVGQLVDLTNSYFKKNKFNARTIHESLFDLNKMKKLIEKVKKPKVIFLFKVLDSLEMLEGDYSKKLLEGIVPLAEMVVVSFATKSMNKRKKFKVNRNWILNFIKDNFNLIDDFEIGSERYVVFNNR